MNELQPPPRRSVGSRVVTLLRILNVRLRFVLLMVVTGLLAAKWDVLTAHVERMFQDRDRSATEMEAAIEYYCPMHPSVVRPDPGSCPICGMPLSKRSKGEAEQLPEGVIGRVHLAPDRMRLAGVATSEVGYHPFTQQIQVPGTIEIDERRVSHIPARIGGRIERLGVTFTGQTVSRGQTLAELYSPDLITTQQELLSALRHYEDLQARMQASENHADTSGPANEATAPRDATSQSPSEAALRDARTILDATRTRLRLWGIDDEEIAALEEGREQELTVKLRSPVSGTVLEKPVLSGSYVEEGTILFTVADLTEIWTTAYVPEHASSGLEAGQEVEILSSSLPNESFRGTLLFIWPVVDATTRTVRVRADVANPQLLLKPGMYVDVTIRTAREKSETTTAEAQYICPMHPEVVSTNPEDRCPKCGMFLEKRIEPAPVGTKLAIPESAVIQTGTQAVVYLEREAETFDAVAVELGALADGMYEVRSGLHLGDRIVTRGAFLVDAEVRLNPAAAGTYFGATGGPTARTPTPTTGSDGNHRH